MATDSSYLAARSLSSKAGVLSRATGLVDVAAIGLVFGLILIAVWTPPGRLSTITILAAVFVIVTTTMWSRFSAGELGLVTPSSGALVMLGAGVLLAASIAAIGAFTRILGPTHAVPWNRAWQYAIWALAQEFILQSFFYVRLESLMGSHRAVLSAALLFAVTHVPNPLLTPLSFLGALFFCEMFRRYRNIFPLGFAHAMLGLTIAASLPDRLLHHMRVGIGFLQYRP